jgi:hypothetical protein
MKHTVQFVAEQFELPLADTHGAPQADDEQSYHEEPELCPGAPGDPRDPAFVPEHRMRFLGESDGHSFYQCRYCTYSYDN